MNKSYIYSLMKQYAAAQGYTHPDYNSRAFISEFEDWIVSMRVVGRDYITFVELLNAKPKMADYETAEIGKGPLDSVILDTNYEMITDNFSGDIINNFCVITPGTFRVINSEPTVDQGGSQRYLRNSGLHRFLTQNPYTPSLLNGWDDMHNSGNSNIAVGVFGHTYDKDRDAKLAQLDKFTTRLDDSVIADMYIDNDSYGAVVASDRQIITRVRTR